MEANSVIRYELEELKRFRTETESWRRHVDQDRRDLEYLRKDFVELTDAVNGLRKMLITFSLSVAGSAIVFALSVLVSTGKL